MNAAENSENQKNHPGKEENNLFDNSTKIIPIVEEFVNVEKRVVETGKVSIHKKIEKEKTTLHIPLNSEEYEVKRVTVKAKLLDERPSYFEEDGKIIVPVVREVPQVIIKYEVTEEIHLIKHVSHETHEEEVTLLKEKAEIRREDLKQQNDDQNYKEPSF